MNNPEITCDCGTDPRLIAGIAAIACHVAKHAQWDSNSQDRAADSAARACHAVFGLIGNTGKAPAHIHVVCPATHDRIELSIELYEEVPQGKLQALAHDFSSKLAHYETGNAHSILKFVEPRDTAGRV